MSFAPFGAAWSRCTLTDIVLVEEALGEFLEATKGVVWVVLCAEEFSQHAEFDVGVSLLVSTDDCPMLLVVQPNEI